VFGQAFLVFVGTILGATIRVVNAAPGRLPQRRANRTPMVRVTLASAISSAQIAKSRFIRLLTAQLSPDSGLPIQTMRGR
jgi:hypothetical protein